MQKYPGPPGGTEGMGLEASSLQHFFADGAHCIKSVLKVRSFPELNYFLYSRIWTRTWAFLRTTWSQGWLIKQGTVRAVSQLSLLETPTLETGSSSTFTKKPLLTLGKFFAFWNIPGSACLFGPLGICKEIKWAPELFSTFQKSQRNCMCLCDLGQCPIIIFGLE